MITVRRLTSVLLGVCIDYHSLSHNSDILPTHVGLLNNVISDTIYVFPSRVDPNLDSRFDIAKVNKSI